MSKDLFKILKELKGIQPDADYSKRSKVLLLSEIKATASPKFKFGYKFILSAVSVTVLFLIIYGGVYYAINKPNQNDLVVKASEANASIQVKLDEIRYLLENNQSGFDPSQISTVQVMLQSAADNLRAAASSKPEDLEKALEMIKTAENALYNIDILIKK